MRGYVFLGILSFCLCTGDVSRVRRSSDDEYVDKVLANARDLIREHNFDPYHLANFQFNFPVKIVFNLNGKLEGWNVQLHGLSSIHRRGETHTVNHPDYVSMSVGLGIDNLIYDGRTHFAAGIFKFTFDLSLTASLVTARTAITFPMDGSKPRVSEFNIDHISEIKANNRNWGIFNWLANLILNKVVNSMRDTIKAQIRQPIINTLNELVEKIPM